VTLILRKIASAPWAFVATRHDMRDLTHECRLIERVRRSNDRVLAVRLRAAVSRLRKQDLQRLEGWATRHITVEFATAFRPRSVSYLWLIAVYRTDATTELRTTRGIGSNRRCAVVSQAAVEMWTGRLPHASRPAGVGCGMPPEKPAQSPSRTPRTIRLSRDGAIRDLSS
jgi:hypothetical protein